MFKKASIVTIVLLLSIVFFYDYRDFYVFYRIFFCSFFAYTAYTAYKNKFEWLTIMLFILAILYNPFYKLLMKNGRCLLGGDILSEWVGLWIILNLLSVAVIIYTNYVFKNKKICDTIFGSNNKDK